MRYVEPRIGVLGEGSCGISPTTSFGSAQPLTRAWLRHGELEGEAKLVFVMSPTPTEEGCLNPAPKSTDALETKGPQNTP